MLKPFFTYFGGKYRLAPYYPPPQRGLPIIEPFCGSAGYALRYADFPVVLNDINPEVSEVWRYLIKVNESEILRLPLKIETRDSIKACQEARWLIGFWLNKGMVSPCNIPSKWMRENDGTKYPIKKFSYWGEGVRARIAGQLSAIRHWKVFNLPYQSLTGVANWFIDPPYSHKPRAYGTEVNYKQLAKWCQLKTKQVIVCEREGATWLPFRLFRASKALEGSHGIKISQEAIWCRGVV
jgi:site-specific DNA-adenine methylase